MTATLAPADWVDVLSREYLIGFIRDGGAAVKFAVSMEPEVTVGLHRALVDAGRQHGYLVAALDAADTKVHLMDQVFFAVARQIDWNALARQVLLGLAAGAGFRVPETETDGPVEELCAAASDLSVGLVRTELRRLIDQQVFRNREMAKDFRVAMTNLCFAALSGGQEGEERSRAIVAWLTGENRLIGPVRPYGIHTRITRTNARHMFESSCRWIRLAGCPGVEVVIDVARLSIPRNPRDGYVFYGKAALFDAFEVLRQFIDATDRLAGFLLVVVARTEFLAEEKGARGMGEYDALKFRIYDEVRDARRANPMAALVRLATRSSEDLA